MEKKEFKGTKGKWRVSEYCRTTVMSDRDLDIADVYDGTDSSISEWTDTNKMEAEANAQLIAAAPELLDRLNSLRLSMKAHPDYQTGRNQEFVDLVSLAEETINKALGKEE